MFGHIHFALILLCRAFLGVRESFSPQAGGKNRRNEQSAKGRFHSVDPFLPAHVSPSEMMTRGRVSSAFACPLVFLFSAP